MISRTIAELRTEIRAVLLEGRNADGGWGYLRGRRSRLEPTCWALLALAGTDRTPPNVASLRGWPKQNGWLVDAPGLPPNVAFNAIAALTLESANDSDRAIEKRIIEQILQFKGTTAAQFEELKQDNSLPAWSWISGTISWVEPTAWCLLALKKYRRDTVSASLDDRISIGDRFLVDRACAVGGWNYGNPNVYGTDLIPHVPTTALGLLAMQDRREHPVVNRALERLRMDAAGERSHLALALSLICMRVYKVDAADLERSLIALCADRLRERNPAENLHALALALCALTTTTQAIAPFSIEARGA
jgi:hypothetical protein